jgi:hypothetical protein
MVSTVKVLLAAALLLLLPASALAARVPMPATLTVHEQTSCPDETGASCSDLDSDQIWLAPGSGRFERYHEIGHQFDRQTLTDTHRAWFKRLFGYPDSADWYATVGPQEKFADAYATCALGRPTRKAHGMTVASQQSGYGYAPGGRLHFRVCNAINVIAYLAR